MYVYIYIIIEVAVVKPSNDHAKCIGDTCLNLTINKKVVRFPNHFK